MINTGIYMSLKELKEIRIKDSNGTCRTMLEGKCSVCNESFLTRKDGKKKYLDKCRSCGIKKGNFDRRGKPRENVMTTAEEAYFVSARMIYRNNGYSDADLTFGEFLKLSQENCHYCDAPPSGSYNIALKKDGTKRMMSSTMQQRVWYPLVDQTSTFVYNGLDRMDSSKTHSKDNVVPCCKMCNMMKRHHPYEEFLSHVEKVYKWIIQKKS